MSDFISAHPDFTENGKIIGCFTSDGESGDLPKGHYVVTDKAVLKVDGHGLVLEYKWSMEQFKAK